MNFFKMQCSNSTAQNNSDNLPVYTPVVTAQIFCEWRGFDIICCFMYYIVHISFLLQVVKLQ